MKTLMELYDDRPLENVLSTEVFRPERTVFICPEEVANNSEFQTKLRSFFSHRGVKSDCIFLSASLLDASAVEKRLREVADQYEDCALDIAGGTDAALFASGLLCAERPLPVFTYSRKRNTFYNIQHAPFAHQLPCQVQLTVEDCFLMAGGSMRKGRVDNRILTGYVPIMDPFFQVFLRFRREWPRIVTYMQLISQKEEDLSARGEFFVKGEHGARLSAPFDALHALEQIGMIQALNINEEEKRLSFHFRDAQIRAWLRDVGSVLELYIWKACRDAGCFHDVVTSAVVDWQGASPGPDRVTNELDVIAVQGVKPVFISCKTCEVKTDALNELAILRDRFGGEVARSAIVTTSRARSPMRHRAMELGIDVIDLDDLKDPLSLRDRLLSLLR